MLNFFCSVLLAFFTSFANAQIFNGPGASALGGAGRAGVTPNEAISLNPATLPQLHGYYIGTRYDSNKADPRSQYGYGVFLTDATDDALFAAGFSYLKYRLPVGTADLDRQHFLLGTGKTIFRNFSTGLYARRLQDEYSTGQSKVDHNVGLGFLYLPLKGLGFSFNFYDFMETTEIFLNPSIAFGSNYIIENVARFAFDVSKPQKNNEFNRYIWMFGVESLFAGGFKLRFGHQWDNYNSRRYVSGGIGWDAPRFSLDYSYQKYLDETEIRHLVDLTLQFW